jgi:fatty-acyl-CoA synthase
MSTTSPVLPRQSSSAPAQLAAAGCATVFGLFRDQARLFPTHEAIRDGRTRLCYGELLRRVEAAAGALSAQSVVAGDRIALLSENRSEVLELMLAAARAGVCVACQSTRASQRELAHCLDLAQPKMVFCSAQQRAKLDALDVQLFVVEFGQAYEAFIDGAAPDSTPEADPEQALLILYTSGTTGLPKGAVISQRAEIYRNLVIRAEFGVATSDAFVAWSPLYHMGAADPSLGTLMAGGTVIIVAGFDADALCDLVSSERIGWLLLMPGMVQQFADELERRHIAPLCVKLCGVMADLVPPHEIARITRLLDAPYANTFGATETGCPPCSSSLIPPGVAPERLSKLKSPFCEIRLVDENDQDVPPGEPGEMCVRGPTLFSGYFRAPETNADALRGGYYHMGDVFRQNADGTLDFVDRVKYLIKSGGENIYPAEIERAILRDARVLAVAVVRQRDERWGEVPVAFVVRRDDSFGEADVEALCRAELASFKRPKRVLFVSGDALPRTVTGKIQRHVLEKQLH